MTNHKVDTCFKKRGYPPHWKHDGSINQYAVVPDTADAVQTEFHGDNKQMQGALAFTPDQHKALLDLLQGVSTSQHHNINHLTNQIESDTGIICTTHKSPSSGHFILDTVATDHVCHTRGLFSMHQNDQSHHN